MVQIDRALDREAMVERQLKSRGIDDPRILDAFRAVPRDPFVGEAVAELAYEDPAPPIEEGQTTSQPRPRSRPPIRDAGRVTATTAPIPRSLEETTS